jgi:hypothetical protein
MTVGAAGGHWTLTKAITYSCTAGVLATLACASGGVRQELERAYAQNRQAFLDKNVDAVMALRTPDYYTVDANGQVHHVQTWVTQRETWRKTAQGWKLRLVDQVHDQRRLIDGQP